MANKFNRLNYMSYERTLMPHCKGLVEVVNSQGIAVQKNITMQYLDSRILLESGLDADEVDRFEYGDGETGNGIGKDVLSAFRNGRSLFEWIVAAYAGKDRVELENMVSLHFEANLMPLLRGQRVQNAKRNLYDIIQLDEEIPQNELIALEVSYEQDPDHVFLAKSFIFAIIRESFTPLDHQKDESTPTPAIPDLETLIGGIYMKLLTGSISSIEEYRKQMDLTDYYTIPTTLHDAYWKGIKACFLIGKPGSGKTKWVNRYIELYEQEYDLVQEFKADSKEHFQQGCTQLLARAGITVRGLSSERRLAATLDYLHSHDKWLMVFKNTDYFAPITDETGKQILMVDFLQKFIFETGDMQHILISSRYDLAVTRQGWKGGYVEQLLTPRKQE